MERQIDFCPHCGTEFDHASVRSDSRLASGYECENCNEMLEIRVNQFPMA